MGAWPGCWLVRLEALTPDGPAAPFEWLPWPGLDRAGPWLALGGSAGALLALELAEGLPGGPRQALALAAGSAVRAGLPTAARATVAGVAPLSDRYVEGQVGGDLGPALAHLGAPLLLIGRAAGPAAVLLLDPSRRARLVSCPELIGASPGATDDFLCRRFPVTASLRVGPAGERGARAAGLVSGSTSFVGRGGLGARFGGDLNLKACALLDFPLPMRQSDGELSRLLLRSPRLEQRAELGTMELFQGAGARGEGGLSAGEGTAIGAAASAARQSARGCRGCPTPCGWTFARPASPAVRAHFGATLALLPGSGAERFDAALGLLAACDTLGVDAKECGAALELWCQALGRSLDAELAHTALERARAGKHPEAVLLDGALATARALGRTAPLNFHGQVAPRGLSSAAALAQWSSTGGSDPMRAFPFLMDAPGGAAAQAESGVAPWIERLWWHQNLVAALDTSGFCAFSAAGLLADGLLTLDGLATRLFDTRLYPAGASPGAFALGLGAALIERRRAFDRRLGAALGSLPPAPINSDDWRALERLRGLDCEPLDTDWESLPLWSEPRACPLPVASPIGASDIFSQASDASATALVPSQRGWVQLAAIGALGRALAQRPDGNTVHLDLPATLGEALAAAAHGQPELLARLFQGPRLLPEVWRAGQRLSPADSVCAGDRLDLILAIAGG